MRIWPLGEVIEAMAWEVGRTGDTELDAEIERLGAMIEAVQREDGYLNARRGARSTASLPPRPEVPAAASRLNPRCLQLWPHVHGTDAMFCALLRRHGG